MTVSDIQPVPRSIPVPLASGVSESSGTDDRALHASTGPLRRDADVRACSPGES